MTAEIWRDFDPNLDLPEELKNARYMELPDREDQSGDPDASIDIQDETSDDDESALDQDEQGTAMDVPSDFTIISQTTRTAPDGTQVVDIVLDVDEVYGAINYEVRLTN